MCYVCKLVSVLIIGMLKCYKCENSHANNRLGFCVIQSYLLLLCSVSMAICLLRVMEHTLRSSDVIGIPQPKGSLSAETVCKPSAVIFFSSPLVP